MNKMYSSGKGKLGTFITKNLSRVFRIAKKPIKDGKFKDGRPSVAIICDPSNKQGAHLDEYISHVANNYNLVMFWPEGCPIPEKISDEKYWRIYNFCNSDLTEPVNKYFSNIFLALPNLEFVVIDANVKRYFMRYLWKKRIASVLMVNQNYQLVGKPFNRILAYATRVIYDDYDTFLHTLANELWAFPDSVDCLTPPLQSNPAETKVYIDKIIDIGKKAKKQLVQENEDARFLAHSREFDIPYWTGKNKYTFHRLHFARRYVRDYKSGASAARPKAGFHPGIYAEHHDLGDARIDPFAHYLKSGKPNGMWNWQVINQPLNQPITDFHQKIALHIHAYYPDMLNSILKKLNANQVRPDLFISIKSEEDWPIIEQITAGYEKNRTIKVVPNRGRDIGPLLTEFGPELVHNYEIIGHIHTKKSLHIKNRTAVEKWNNFLMVNLLGDGNSLKMADTILSYMHSHERTALIFPDDKYAVSWRSNYLMGLKIAKRLNIHTLPKYVIFPTGTMFWIKAEALRSFVDLGFSWQDYPEEPLPSDGTLLHAIERMFALNCQHQGFDIATTYLPWTMR